MCGRYTLRSRGNPKLYGVPVSELPLWVPRYKVESENREYDVGDNLVRREVFLYDGDGRMTETHYYDSTNVLRGKGISERDQDGALLAQRYFDL